MDSLKSKPTSTKLAAYLDFITLQSVHNVRLIPFTVIVVEHFASFSALCFFIRSAPFDLRGGCFQ
jgi:hypothetical protein